MSGFWAGSVPPWGIVVCFCLVLLAGCVGAWAALGWRADAARELAEAEADEVWAAELAGMREELARWRHPTGRPQRHRSGWCRDPSCDGLHPLAEVAHEAWTAHVEQALDLADDQPHRSDVLNYEHFDCCGKGMVPKPDPRTDTAWTRDMAADMTAFLAGLLDEHPLEEA
jgi:hypothetical protein